MCIRLLEALSSHDVHQWNCWQISAAAAVHDSTRGKHNVRLRIVGSGAGERSC